jgi:hypothetical protein
VDLAKRTQWRTIIELPDIRANACMINHMIVIEPGLSYLVESNSSYRLLLRGEKNCGSPLPTGK